MEASFQWDQLRRPASGRGIRPQMIGEEGLQQAVGIGDGFKIRVSLAARCAAIVPPGDGMSGK